VVVVVLLVVLMEVVPGVAEEENDEDEGELDSAIDGTPLAQLRFVWDRSMLDEDEHNNFCAKSTSCCCATFLCGDGRPCGDQNGRSHTESPQAIRRRCIPRVIPTACI
jgi:hypothetical protein